MKHLPILHVLLLITIVLVPSATPAIAASSRTIYDDTLAAGWENWSWTNSVNFGNTTPVKSGMASIKVQFTAAWQGFSLRTATPLRGSDYSALAFAIYGGAGGNQVQVYLQTGDAGDPPATHELHVAAGVWTDVSIPLSALGNPATIARITIQENAGTAQQPLYLDDLRLVVGAGSPSEGTGTVQVNGYTRTFVYAVSAQPEPVSGRPLVIHLHGDGGDMQVSTAWRSAVLNDGNGAVFVSAQGRNRIPEAAAIDGSAWRFRMDEAGRPYDDIDFIDQVITQATASSALFGTTIDPNQVYVVGESRGAGMAYYLYADPRTRNNIRAIVPISGTFYCDGGVQSPGTPGTQPLPGSDTTCGAVSAFGFWAPRPELFSAPAVTRSAHILAIYGQVAPNGSEFGATAPPQLDVDYGATTWAGWADAAGCYSVQVSSQTEQMLPQRIGGKPVKSYAYSQSAESLSTRCAGLDLTFSIVQGGGHVPPGAEATAWCFLSTVGGKPSSTACAGIVQPPPELSQRVFLPLLQR